jgi:hypothetical protein
MTPASNVGLPWFYRFTYLKAFYQHIILGSDPTSSYTFHLNMNFPERGDYHRVSKSGK